MLIHAAKKTRLSLPNKNSLGIYTGYGGAAGFTRATTKTCKGYLENALPGDPQYILTIPSGVPCFSGLRFIASDNTWSNIYSDGNVIDKANLGVLIEKSSSNLVLQSENITGWVDNGTTRLLDSEFKNLTFIKASETTVNSVHYFYRSITNQNNYVCCSVFVKKGSRRYVGLTAATNGLLIRQGVLFDIDIGVFVSLAPPVGTPTGIKYGIDDYGDGVYRIWVKIDAVGTSHHILPFLSNSATPTWSSYSSAFYQGDVNEYGLFSGMVLEDSEYPTSYIKTTTSAATRNADIQTIQTAQNINRYQGSLSFEFTPTHNAVGTVALGGSYVDANNYTQILHVAGTGYIFRKRISGVNYDAPLSGDFVADTTYTVKIKWSSYSGMEIFINGTKGTNNPDTKPLQLGSTWQIGADGNGGQQAGACFKNVLTKYK